MTAVTVAKQGPQGIQVLIDEHPDSTEGRSVDSTAIRATIATICDSTREDSAGITAGNPFAILPAGLDVDHLAQSVQNYLRQLTLGANAAAAALFCGSILAGHTSEADEFGDIAFWLPGEGDVDYGAAGHEVDILNLLGLNGDSIIPDGGQVREVEVSPETGLPSTVGLSPGEGAEVQQLRKLLSYLRGVRIFSCAHSQGGVEVYVLFGCYEGDAQSGWAGLVGIGVET
ncbi:hypothetical protein C8Q79DRAFT_1011671 [Trametes meyenii]|nr:hypothetical protein C8Q79DRAFT_1011671 [Trametes meyenii]